MRLALRLVLKTFIWLSLRLVVVLGIAIGFSFAIILLINQLNSHTLRNDRATAAFALAIIMLAMFDWTAVCLLLLSALRHPGIAEIRARLTQYFWNAVGASFLSVYAAAGAIKVLTNTLVLPGWILFAVLVTALLLFSAQSVSFVTRYFFEVEEEKDESEEATKE